MTAARTKLLPPSPAMQTAGKELACLYSISQIMERRNISLDEMLQGVADVLSSPWLHPEITFGRVVFEGQAHTTENFKETPWMQVAEINVEGARQGVVELYYGDEYPVMEDVPLHKGERNLIDDIASRLSRYIEYRRHQELIKSSGDKYRDLVEHLSCSILNVCDNRISLANMAMVNLVGANSADDITGRNFLDIVHADSRDDWKKILQAENADEVRLNSVEIKLLRLSDRRVVEVDARAIKIGSGETNQFQVVMREIRERMQVRIEKLFARLSKRERQIMEMVIQGETSRVIATHLGISKRTVENHRANLFKKMEAQSLADLIREATMLGIR